MEFFGKKFSSALLFGAMIFSTVNSVSVYGEESDTIVEQVAEELGDASNDVQDLSENDETREDKVVGSQNKSSGSKFGFGLAGAAGGALVGVASGIVAPGSSGTDDRNKVEALQEELNKARSELNKARSELNKARSESNNFQSELKSSNKELDKLRSDLKKMKQSDGGTSVFDAIGVLSYIPGIGSDCKTDSGINAGKLATVITMHVIGIIIICFLLYGRFGKKTIASFNLYDYASMACDVICPPVGIAMNVGRYLHFGLS